MAATLSRPQGVKHLFMHLSTTLVWTIVIRSSWKYDVAMGLLLLDKVFFISLNTKLFDPNHTVHGYVINAAQVIMLDSLALIKMRQTPITTYHYQYWAGGRFKNTYELLNLRALKFSYMNKIHIFQCVGKIFCVEFQRYPLKFHTKNLTHTLKDMTFIQHWKFKSS